MDLQACAYNCVVDIKQIYDVYGAGANDQTGGSTINGSYQLASISQTDFGSHLLFTLVKVADQSPISADLVGVTLSYELGQAILYKPPLLLHQFLLDIVQRVNRQPVLRSFGMQLQYTLETQYPIVHWSVMYQNSYANISQVNLGDWLSTGKWMGGEFKNLGELADSINSSLNPFVLESQDVFQFGFDALDCKRYSIKVCDPNAFVLTGSSWCNINTGCKNEFSYYPGIIPSSCCSGYSCDGCTFQLYFDGQALVAWLVARMNAEVGIDLFTGGYQDGRYWIGTKSGQPWTMFLSESSPHYWQQLGFLPVTYSGCATYQSERVCHERKKNLTNIYQTVTSRDGGDITINVVGPVSVEVLAIQQQTSQCVLSGGENITVFYCSSMPFHAGDIVSLVVPGLIMDCWNNANATYSYPIYWVQGNCFGIRADFDVSLMLSSLGNTTLVTGSSNTWVLPEGWLRAVAIPRPYEILWQYGTYGRRLNISPQRSPSSGSYIGYPGPQFGQPEWLALDILELKDRSKIPVIVHTPGNHFDTTLVRMVRDEARKQYVYKDTNQSEECARASSNGLVKMQHKEEIRKLTLKVISSSGRTFAGVSDFGFTLRLEY
jgi:hypothetical protein